MDVGSSRGFRPCLKTINSMRSVFRSRENLEMSKRSLSELIIPQHDAPTSYLKPDSSSKCDYQNGSVGLGFNFVNKGDGEGY